MFIVIEGDNGSGKTTVASEIKNMGYLFVTEREEIKALELNAKDFSIGSRKRFDAFIEYNRICGNYTNKVDKILMARYWLSTVSAAYADGLFTLDEALKIGEKIECALPKPDFIFRLYCNFDVRISRLEIRNAEADDKSDDVSLERNKRYSDILDELDKRLSYMYTIDTSDKSPKQVVKVLIELIGGK